MDVSEDSIDSNLHEEERSVVKEEDELKKEQAVTAIESGSSGGLIEKAEALKQQNQKLKIEFSQLKAKLEDCLKSFKPQKSDRSKPEPHNTDLEKQKKYSEMQRKLAFYKKETKGIVKQLEDTLNVNKIVEFENEEREKRKMIEDLEGEKCKLRKLQRSICAVEEYKNGRGVVTRKDEIYEKLREKKQELKDKQAISRKQEKQIKEQHELIISLEEKCKKLKEAIVAKRTQHPKNADKKKSQEEIDDRIKILEFEIFREKNKYKQLIDSEESAISDLTIRLDHLLLQIKQKDQECRLNSLKVSELKRQLKAGNPKSESSASIKQLPALQYRQQDKRGCLFVEGEKDKLICRSLDQFKRDMQTERVVNPAKRYEMKLEQ